jgi:hypothetical protein
MMIHDIGTGLLVQLDDKDIASLHYSILELGMTDEAQLNISHINRWLLPFLKYLLAETGEIT